MSDFIQSREPEKAVYRYEQSVQEAEYIVNHLTVENQIIFDPTMSSGTTGIAALANKRKFIGCEKNKDVFELAKKRITSFHLGK
jgi:DNA modification methylase